MREASYVIRNSLRQAASRLRNSLRQRFAYVIPATREASYVIACGNASPT
ncbi:hypothetical protein [Calothrix sp. NIES-3974]|nr:hypothetical protein [Calothrix sp. NIES-3974]